MATTKIHQEMTQNVLRTDITNQSLTANTVLTNAGFNKALPIGTLLLWPRATVPEGWLECTGTTYNIADYPTLGALLGSTYGGNGTTTFSVPSIKASVPSGLSAGSGTYIIRALNANK